MESYLRYQGRKFVERFDANSFLYITKAVGLLSTWAKQHGDGSLVKAFSKAAAKFLVISFTSDWLYPTYQAREIVKALKKTGRDVSFCEIEAEFGHDSFLLAHEQLTRLISGFLNGVVSGQKGGAPVRGAEPEHAFRPPNHRLPDRGREPRPGPGLRQGRPSPDS